MKKHTFLVLIAALSFFMSKAQLFWTTSNGGPWQAYTVAGTPAGWPSSSGTANWGNPIAGWGNPGPPTEFSSIQALFPSGLTPNINNFVWARTTTLTPMTTYYRLKYTVAQGDCRRVKIHVCSDEDRVVYVNGQQVEQNLTGSPWSEFRTVDITDKLVCGDNYITAKVTNLSLYCLFVACLEVTNQSASPFNLSLTYTIDCDQPNLLNLSAGNSNSNGVTFLWSGPNGFSSTAKNPAVTPVTKATHQGWYKCVATTTPCCKKTDSVFVTIPDNCCDAEINYNRINCNNFTFTLSSTVVNLNCWYWTVDGSVVQNGGVLSRVLAPGNHVICANYLGTQKKNPDIICCSTKCTTVNIPSPVEQMLNITYCPLLGNQGALFNPCDYNPPTVVNMRHEIYVKIPFINGYIPYYMSTIGGCDTHTLSEGEYQIKYYDEAGCLLKTILLTVTKQYVNYIQCNKVVEDSCNVSISPDTVVPDCPGCMGINSQVGLTTATGFDPVTQTTGYQREYTNLDNCTVCLFTFSITRGCSANASFTMVELGPGLFGFLNTSTGTGNFFSGHYKDYSATVTNFHTETGPNSYLPFTHTLAPGIHTLCLTVFFVKCGVECASTKCYTVTITPDGHLESILGQRAAPPLNVEPATQLVAESKLTIIPNPASSVFRIKFSDDKITEYDRVEIKSPEGKTLQVKQSISSSAQYNLTEYASGMYYVIVQIKDKIYKEKITLTK